MVVVVVDDCGGLVFRNRKESTANLRLTSIRETSRDLEDVGVCVCLCVPVCAYVCVSINQCSTPTSLASSASCRAANDTSPPSPPPPAISAPSPSALLTLPAQPWRSHDSTFTPSGPKPNSYPASSSWSGPWKRE